MSDKNCVPLPERRAPCLPPSQEWIPTSNVPGCGPTCITDLISVASDLLLPRFRPRYFVRIEERVYLSEEGDEEVHEARLEIIDRERDQVVTVIEVVSPTNKTAHSRGRESYLQKRHEVMTSPTHWVEIDLLRQGQPVIRRSGVPSFDYAAHVSRAERRPRGRFLPIRLPDPLPGIDIPLRKDDSDAPLDLQTVLNTVYDRAGYDLQLNYREESGPPLSSEQAAWADALLRGKGLR